MSTHARTAATALFLIGAIAGCSNVTSGTVAMTTEAGPATTRSSTQSTTPSTSSRSSTSGPTSDVPAPTDSLTITCADYADLDEATQRAIVNEILKQQGSVLAPGNSDVAKTLADAVCQFLPESTVSEVLLGGPVP